MSKKKNNSNSLNEEPAGISSRLFYFVTPVFYTLDSISPTARKFVVGVNPITPFVMSMRDIFMGKEISFLVYGHSLSLGCIFFILGYGIFLMLEDAAVERA